MISLITTCERASVTAHNNTIVSMMHHWAHREMRVESLINTLADTLTDTLDDKHIDNDAETSVNTVLQRRIPPQH